MSKYILTVGTKEVNKWSDMDGMGSYVGTHEIDLEVEIGTVGNELTVDTIAEAIADLLDVSILGSNISCCNREYGMFDIIEDSNGLQSDGGDYISYYSFTIKPDAKSLNLEKMFG